MGIQNVIFDFGRVVIDADPKYLLLKLFGCERKVDEFLDTVPIHEEWHIPADLGQSTSEITESLASRFPQYENEIREYDRRWGEILGNINPGMTEIIDELSKNEATRLYGLTNWPEGKFYEAQQRIPFIGQFTDVVVSSVERLAKPDPRIYQTLLGRNNLNPETCIFIDDRLENVEAGEALGIRGHHFTTTETLRDELKTLHLL